MNYKYAVRQYRMFFTMLRFYISCVQRERDRFAREMEAQQEALSASLRAELEPRLSAQVRIRNFCYE
jgi:hypothetical protein